MALGWAEVVLGHGQCGGGPGGAGQGQAGLQGPSGPGPPVTMSDKHKGFLGS